MSADQLIVSIRRAFLLSIPFSKVPIFMRPEDDMGAELKLGSLRSRRWDSVTSEVVAMISDDLCVLNEDAFCFLLPAVLIRALDKSAKSGDGLVLDTLFMLREAHSDHESTHLRCLKPAQLKAFIDVCEFKQL